MVLASEEISEQAIAEHRYVLTTRLGYAAYQQNVIYNLFTFIPHQYRQLHYAFGDLPLQR